MLRCQRPGKQRDGEDAPPDRYGIAILTNESLAFIAKAGRQSARMEFLE